MTVSLKNWMMPSMMGIQGYIHIPVPDQNLIRFDDDTYNQRPN